jgi:hypothetical protein
VFSSLPLTGSCGDVDEVRERQQEEQSQRHGARHKQRQLVQIELQTRQRYRPTQTKTFNSDVFTIGVTRFTVNALLMAFIIVINCFYHYRNYLQSFRHVKIM